MPNNNSNSGPEPEQADSLSATAMFLKAFEVDTKKAADPLPIDTATPPSPRQVSPAPERVPARQRAHPPLHRERRRASLRKCSIR